MAPAREIAVQVREVVRLLGRHMGGLMCHACIGGLSIAADKVQPHAAAPAC